MDTPYRQVALALLEAEEADNPSATLSNGLLEVAQPAKLIELMTSLACVLAYHSEETPRTIYEQLYASCPADATWRDIAEAWREERENK